jgi:hypothetical protein
VAPASPTSGAMGGADRSILDVARVSAPLRSEWRFGGSMATPMFHSFGLLPGLGPFRRDAPPPGGAVAGVMGPPKPVWPARRPRRFTCDLTVKHANSRGSSFRSPR